MPINDHGIWVPDISPKQLALLNNNSRLLLVSGPRYCGKTIACLHRLLLHGWRTPNARVSVVAISQTSAADSGVWTTLCEHIAPMWIDNVGGLEWHRKPFTEGATKKQKFQITNAHGSISTFQLDSLMVEKDVEERFKNKNFTCVYVSELSMFFHERTFTTLIDTLRDPANRIPFEDFQFIGDTNPSDEGQDSWIYNLWYKVRVARDTPEEYKPFAALLDLMEFKIEDNTFVPESILAIQRAKYLRDPDLKARYCDGLWTRATGDAIFGPVFKPALCVLGELKQDDPEDEWLFPNENCTELITGSDLGDKNPAMHIIERFLLEIEEVNEKGKPVTKLVTAFKVIDELVYLGAPLPTEQFSAEWQEKMHMWEAKMGHRVEWRHWSDADRYSAAADSYEHTVVFDATDGEIDLREAIKGPGSVWPRVKILYKLLFEGRLFISKVKCPKTIEMFQGLRPGKGINGELERTKSIDKTSPARHVFDSLSYAISMECRNELETKIRTPRVGAPVQQPVMVAL